MTSAFVNNAPVNVFPPEGSGVAGIPWGLDSQIDTAPRNLTDDFGTGAGPKMFQWESLEEIV